MNFSDYELDLSLFVIFQNLMKVRNVTETAKHLDLSQPAVSRKLAKLRGHFNDPLFVKTGRGLAPTPFAIEIEPFVKELVTIYQTQIHLHEKYEPSRSERRFRIASSEIGHSLLLPPLLKACSTAAPNIRLDAVRPRTNTLVENLESGEVDVAFGAYPKLYSGIYEKTLASESYVCAVRKGHPDFDGEVTIEHLMNADHIIISTKGLGHIHRQIEKQFLEICPKNRIKLVCDSFFTAALLVEQTDCIATLPSRLAGIFGQGRQLQYLKPPIVVPSFEIKLYWHERFHKAPANQWLRNTITDIMN